MQRRVTVARALCGKRQALSDAQLRYAVACAARVPVVDRAAVAAFIDELRFPVVSLDFECTQFAVPIPFARVDCWEHVPYLFSAHIARSKTALLGRGDAGDKSTMLEHREYIHLPHGPATDPRPAVAARLGALFAELSVVDNDAGGGDSATTAASSSARKTGKPRRRAASQSVKPTARFSEPAFRGSLLCHNAHFESRMLTRLANLCPDALPPRYHPHKLHFMDTVQLLRNGVSLHQSGGSASLKRVLPTLATSATSRASYDTFSGHLVTEGMVAASVFWLLGSGYQVRDGEALAQLSGELRRYCAADSMGSIELVRGCAELAGIAS